MKVKLDKIIKIQKRKLEQNDNGFEKETWEDYLKAFAGVNNLFGKEYWEAAAVQGETTVQFITRYDVKFEEINKSSSDFRLIFNNIEYDIIPPIDNVKYSNNLVKIRGKAHER